MTHAIDMGARSEADGPFRWRRRLAFLLVSLAFAALVARVVHINLVLAEPLESRLQSQHTRRIEIPARRGMVFDRAGRVLAGTRAVDSIFADPSMLEREEGAVARLASALGVSEGLVRERFSTGGSPSFCWIERAASEPDVELLTGLDLRAIGIVREPHRDYPMGFTLAHVLGFVGVDQQGLAGIELSYDAHLRGTPGSRRVAVSASRQAICDLPGESVAPDDGGHVVVTIDSVIQQWTEDVLAQTVMRFEAEGGAAIVMDPRTGDVLAMASLPTYRPDRFKLTSEAERTNTALTEQVEPGSTMKPFIAAAAMAAGLTWPEDVIDCHDGAWYFGRRLIRDTKPRGKLKLPDVLVKSSNIGMSQLGMRMGNELLYKTVRAFGFGQKTGIELAGEGEGILRPLEEWTSYSTQSIAFGQEISVTPMQLITAFCGLINDGVLLKPRLVRALLAADGTVVQSNEKPEIVRRVIPAEVAQYFRDVVLVRVVQEGGGDQAQLPHYQVLGKTGTAQVASSTSRGYEPRAYVSSFIGAAPAGDPAVAVLVMIRRPNPDIAYYGRFVAGPAVKDILARTLPYMGVPPSDETPLQTSPRAQLAGAME